MFRLIFAKTLIMIAGFILRVVVYVADLDEDDPIVEITRTVAFLIFDL